MYVFLTYTFVAAIAYTIFNLAYAGIIPLMSHDSEDRSMISTVQMIIVYIGVMVMSFVTPVLLVKWGGYNSQGSWGKLATVYAILCAFLCAAIGLLVKEKPDPAVEYEKKVPENRNTKVLLKEVLSSKYTWIVIVLFIAYAFSTGTSAITTYLWTYVLHNFEMQGTASLVASPLVLIAFFLTPVMLKKVSKEKLIIYGQILMIICRIITAIFSRNMMITLIVGAIATAGMAPMMALSFTFTADLIEYFSRKKGIHVEGLASMAFSVGTKIGTGFGGAIVGWGLALAGFASEVAAQTAQVETMIIFIANIVPIIMALITIICVKKWKIKNA